VTPIIIAAAADGSDVRARQAAPRRTLRSPRKTGHFNTTSDGAAGIRHARLATHTQQFLYISSYRHGGGSPGAFLLPGIRTFFGIWLNDRPARCAISKLIKVFNHVLNEAARPQVAYVFSA
jgi:hypothetical protein